MSTSLLTLAALSSEPGISAASGIPTFRGEEPGSIWSERTLNYGRLSTFSRNPLQWYNDFWLAGVIPWRTFYSAQPNRAHDVIASLARENSLVKVVSQNIDTLHFKAGTPEAQLLLAHGSAEFFQCVGSSHRGSENCNSGRVKIDLNKFSSVPSEVPREATSVRVPPSHIFRVPQCASCGGSMRPACLMFDEDYDDNVWSTYESWIADTKAIVFVGSSNAVGLTSDALRAATRRRIPIFNFNLNRKCMEGVTALVYHVLGPADESLSKLSRLVEEERGKRQ